MIRLIAIYGGSFNPPGVHHVRLVETAKKMYDEVVVVPCGGHADKLGALSISSEDRRVLVEAAFGGLGQNVRIDTYDLAYDAFTPSWDLVLRYAPRGTPMLAVGADLIRGGAAGNAEIQRKWYRGRDLWRTVPFIVFRRPEWPWEPRDMPPNGIHVNTFIPGASTMIRERLLRGENVDGLVPPAVRDIIESRGLYRRGEGTEHG